MLFEVWESNKFREELEEAILWLYSHNLEQSEKFANQKHLELQQEVNALENRLKRNPQIGQADEISGIRRFPLYNGRYLATWLTVDVQKKVILLEFIDSKYPKNLRRVAAED